MDDRKEIKYKLCIGCVFCVMLVLLYQQFRVVHIYFDDYAYYSLSYARSFNGTKNYTILQLLEFMKAHYMECNGRLLYFFVWLLLFWLGGLPLVQLSTAVIMVGVLWVLWKAASLKMEGYQKVLAAISVCALYWSLDIVFLRQGIYWFAAFFLYVMPVGVLVLAALLYFEFLGGERNTAGNKMTILLLIFAAGWSQEQQAAVTTVFAFLLMLHAIWVKKEKCCAAILYVIPAILALLIVIMSPGIQARLESADNGIGLIENIGANARQVVYLLGTASSWRINIFIFLSIMLISICDLKYTKSKVCKGFDAIQIVINGCLIYGYVLKQTAVEIFIATGDQTKVIIIGTIIALSIMIQVIRFEIRENNAVMLLVFLSAMASVAALFFVPQRPNRLLIFFTLSMVAVCVQAICSLIDPLEKKTVDRSIAGSIVAVMIVMGLKNGTTIYRGYAENYEVLKDNDQTIQRIVRSSGADEREIEIRLKKTLDPMYCCVAPDDENYSEILQVFMNDYYGLPEDTKYVYVDR